MAIDNLYDNINGKNDIEVIKKLNLYKDIKLNEDTIDPEKDNVYKKDRQPPIKPNDFKNLYNQLKIEPKSIKNEVIDTSTISPTKSNDLGNVNK